jgi:glycosyltransferase involved in cell wall biosynthesis
MQHYQRPMKIVYVIPTMGCGGAEILIGIIARKLAAHGHEVHILCLQPHHETWPNYPDKEAFLKEVKVHIIGGGVRFKFLRMPQIDNQAYVAYLNSLQPDVVHAHLFLSELMVYSHLQPGTRYFSHGHDNMIQLKRFSMQTLRSKTALANYWERFWLVQRYRKAQNTFIAISLDVRDYLRKQVGSFVKDIVYLPNAINITRFRTSRSYEPITGRFRLVSIANLVPKKNHTYLIDVVKVLHDRGFDIEAEVLGDGPLMNALREKVDALGLEDRFFFRGSVGDVPQRLWNAHLYVHPAWYEPFGLVLLEAMASGLPVVSLDGYGNRELMKEGQNGYLIPAQATPEAFADKIQYFIENPDERRKQGMWAASFVEAYDIDHYVDALEALYRKN